MMKYITVMPGFSSSSLRLIGILLFLLSFCIAYSCMQEQSETTGAYPGDLPANHTFVGDQTCQSCHAQEWEGWKSSHHDYAMAEPNEESVRGDFENAEFSEGSNRYRFFRDEEQYKVEVIEPDAESDVYEISYTFGWEPLQQYLIDIGSGKLQALHIAWDTERNRWFSLQPDEEYEPGDWMHWQGGAMNWNTMCADCHSTNLNKNFIAEADSFHTTWSVLNVSCEACHGPGEDHVDFMNSPEAENASQGRIREDLNLSRMSSQFNEINTCAPCHSLRQKLTDNYIHGDNYLDHFDPQLPNPDNYFADGQIQGEVYVYGSFLQSKMFAEGVQCTDCHNPHTLELKEPLVNNQLCMQCHEPQYNTPDHHFHEMNTEASQCVNCHMTGRTYMEVDYRRDHSFRVPRPRQSEQFGTPNACNNCHTDQPAEWAARAVKDWYGEEDRTQHFSDVLIKAADDADADMQEVQMELSDLIADTTQPEIIRATAVWYTGRYPDMNTSDIIAEALKSESATIRSSAAKAVENLPSEMRALILREALNDTVKVVRVFAMQNLTAFSANDFGDAHKDHFQNALQEYKSYLEVNRYFPQGEMNRGQFYEQQEDIEKAIEAYRNTLKRDPQFNPARMNLAYLYNSRGNNNLAEELLKEVINQEPAYGQAHYSLGLLLAEDNRLQEAVSYFERSSELLTEQSRVFYNLAVANQTIGKLEKAETAYKQAIEIESGNGDYVYGLVTLFVQQRKYEEALEQALILNEIHPDNPQIQQLINGIEQKRIY